MTDFVVRPSLSRWGIEEVEANVCEDTFENRQKLGFAKVPFKIFEPGLIEVDLDFRGEELNATHRTMYEKYRGILVTERDPWSDYQPFDELPLDYMETAPAWIQRHLNKYRDARDSGTPESKLPILPVRCSRNRADGSRCWGWSWPAESCKGMCRQHAGKFAFDAVGQMAQVRDAARIRISQLTPHAVEALEDLMLNSTVPHVRLKAATELLDRDGIRGGSELTISGQVEHITDPAQAVRDKLQVLADRLKPKELSSTSSSSGSSSTDLIVDAELVDDLQLDSSQEGS